MERAAGGDSIGADGPGTFENPENIEDETDWVPWRSAGSTIRDGRSTISFVSASSMRDPRRFRINLVLDGDDDDLEGVITIGSCTLTVRKPIERCVMFTRAQPGIDRDLTVPRTIIRERGNQLGVSARPSLPPA